MTEPAPPRSASGDRPRLRVPRVARWFKRLMLAGALLGSGLGVAAGLVLMTVIAPSMSMWPTLGVGERLFASRLTAPPERGRIVIFRYPEHPEQSFVKRIIGLPGDVVAVTHGALSINGWLVPRCVVGKASYADAGATGDSGARHEGLLAVEWLGAAAYLVFEEKTPLGATGEGASWHVAAGQYFVLGDNRNNSHDSRTWFGGAGGGVPFASTRGRVRGHDAPAIPAGVEGADDLTGALKGCLAKRPAETTPPAR